MNVSKDKIVLSLDLSINITGNVITQKNAKKADARIQEQFKSNSVNFTRRSNGGTVIIKR